MIYRVTDSPFSCDEDFPWDYTEDGLISWVDEVFMEGYKQPEGTPFPSLDDCLGLLEGSGYTVEMIDD